LIIISIISRHFETKIFTGVPLTLSHMLCRFCYVVCADFSNFIICAATLHVKFEHQDSNRRLVV